MGRPRWSAARPLWPREAGTQAPCGRGGPGHARALAALGYKLTNQHFFDTLDIEAEAAVIQSLALERGINFFYPSEERVRLSFDEVTTPDEVAEVVVILNGIRAAQRPAALSNARSAEQPSAVLASTH